MFRKCLSVALAVVLLHISVRPVLGASRGDDEPTQIAKIRADVAKRGIGEKAVVRVRLRDKKELKGYIAEAGDDRFVISEKGTGETIPLAYGDVDQVKSEGLSNRLLWVGGGLVVAATAAAFAFSGVAF